MEAYLEFFFFFLLTLRSPLTKNPESIPASTIPLGPRHTQLHTKIHNMLKCHIVIGVPNFYFH